MKEPHKRYKEPTRNFVFTVTTPTLELNSVEYIDQLIQQHTHYQVIPSPLALNYDVEKIIASALPFTKNKLLDITLPLTVADSSGNQINYLGRYLIYDRRLIGIKLSSSKREELYSNSEFKKWKSGKATKYKIPKMVQDYYKSMLFQQGTYEKDILIGDFTLSIGDIKICILFQSQIEDNESVLFQYKRQGCEIFSVVCDLPRDTLFQNTLNINSAKLTTKNENMFKRFIRQNKRLMLYAGVRMATPKSLFLSNSFILHPELPQKGIEPFFFNDGVSISVVCNVEFIKAQDIKQARREKINENRAKPEIFINSPFLPLKEVLPGKSIKTYANGQRQLSNFTKEQGDLLKKMRLWFIFCSDNRSSPFITSLPLTQKMNEVAKQLQRLSFYLQRPLSSFIIFYKKYPQTITTEFQQSLGVVIYQNLADLLSKCKQERLNIYTDDQDHYQLLSSKFQRNQRVRLYYDYISFKEDKGENKILVERAHKMNEFANTIIKNRIIGYHKILAQSRSENWRLNKDEQIQSITVFLKNKLRLQVNNHPFYKNILNRTAEEIRDALIEAETQMILMDQNMSMMVEENIPSILQIEEENSIESEEKDKEFLGKLKDMKRSQVKQQKKSYGSCHRCDFYHEKAVFHRCNICKNEICYLCVMDLSNKMEKDFKSKKDFTELLRNLECIVCKKSCKCAVCKNKGKHEESADAVPVTKILQISQPISGINEQQNDKKESTQPQSCTACLINQRKTSNIKVSCSTCDKEECLACVRSQNRKIETITSQWQCTTCKPLEITPYMEPMIDEQQQANLSKMDIEDAAARQPSLSKSRSGSPAKKNRPNFNNQRNNSNQNPRNNFSNNNYNNSKGKGKMIDENQEKRSVSKSKSPPRRPFNNNNNNNFNNKKENQNNRKASPSRSGSPPKRQQNFNRNPPPAAKKSPKRSCSRSLSPPRNKNKQQPKPVEKKKSASRSNSRSKSPPRNRNPRPNQAPQKTQGASRSKSPIRNNTKSNKQRNSSKSKSRSPPRNQNLKKTEKKKSVSRSNSRSKSPPKNQNIKKTEKKKSASASNSRSKSPPRKQPVRAEEKKDASRSQSKEKRKPVKKSISRSRSGSKNSRSRSREVNRNNSSNDNNRNNQQPEKLWNTDKNKDNKWGNQNYNNRDRNQGDNQGGYNNRDRNQGDNQGGYNNRGGYNSNRGRGRGGFDRNQGNSDRNEQRGQGNYNRRGGYNNNSSNNNSNYNNSSNYNSRDRDNSRNASGDNDNQLLNVNTYQSNNDVEY